MSTILTNPTVVLSRPMLITGHVDPSTGNVDAPHDLHVTGNVVDLHQVRCGGSACVEGVVEAAVLDVRGQLVARGGISGKGKGRCNVGGCIDARYLLNATVEAEGEMRVQAEISFSRVIAGGGVKIAAGALVGGHLTTMGSLSCATLGASAGTPTIVEVGFDEPLRRLAASSIPKIDRCRRESARIRAAATPMMKLQKSLTREQKEQLTEMLFEAEGMEMEAEELVTALRKRWNALLAMPSPQINVAETLHSGVTIRFLGVQAVTDRAIDGPICLTVRSFGGQKCIFAVSAVHQRTYSIPSREWHDPALEGVARCLESK